jgi:predicted outer membrane repeat protein
MATNTPEAPLVLALDPSVDFTESATKTALSNAFDVLEVKSSRYVTVDLSAYTFTTIDETSSFVFTRACVAGIVFPETLTTIEYGSFYGTPGLRSITIPAAVTSIGSIAFSDCVNLTRVTFAGNNAVLQGGAFLGNLITVYNNQATKAGTYVYSTGSWSKE